MKDFLWIQLFAEGEGEASGVTAPDAEEQQLKALGVPEEKIRNGRSGARGRLFPPGETRSHSRTQDRTPLSKRRSLQRHPG